MNTPDRLDRQHTLATAVARYEDLRYRSVLASAAAELAAELAGTAGSAELAAAAGSVRAGWAAGELPEPPSLSMEEALELLSLGELIVRKAGYGRQLDIRSARAAGASWSQIGESIGTSKQSAWEAHSRWIDGQAEQHQRSGYEGLDEDEINAARALAGEPDEPDVS
jgi:hypothetical protein